MHSFRRTFGGGVAVAGVIAWLVLAGTASADVPKSSRAAANAAQQPGYAGEEACLTCHENRGTDYRATKHAQAWNARAPAANQGCESCHGPGQAHIDASGDVTKIKKFSSMAAKDVDATCVTCHNRSDHMAWEGSAHESRGVSCLSCHSVHAPKSEKATLKTATQMETCQACHRDKVQKVRRSAHMPVQEGKLECSSCHNAHGATNEKLLRVGNSVSESCVSCHTEKRGPSLWDHAPVEESCTTCHDPHGSSSERMLVAKQPFLCQRCHVTARHPPTVYNPFVQQTSTNANKIYGRSCTVCHQTLHGSNHPSGKAFLR